MKPYVALGMPRRTKLREDMAYGIAARSSSGECALLPFYAHSSLLNHSFNSVWVQCHNFLIDGHKLTHLAILHDDIEPSPCWIDTLAKELDATGADLISAYAPIKSEQGLVSMATYQDDIWDLQRFTIRQLARMPETFTQDDVKGNLLLNTGCCLLRLRDPWLSRPEDFVFDDRNRIVRLPNGRLQAEPLSEDWRWSDAIRRAGGKLAATRKVGLAHEGTKDFRNDTVWGSWERDASYIKRHENDHEDQISSGLHVSPERPGQLAGV